MFSIRYVDNYVPHKQTTIVDEHPVIVEKGYSLETRGVSTCTVVCVVGSINQKEYIGIAHILSDIAELNYFYRFNKIFSAFVIGATDDWFSKPLFDDIVLKIRKHATISLQTHFNPTDSDPHKLIDIYIDQQAHCYVRTRTISEYKNGTDFSSRFFCNPSPNNLRKDEAKNNLFLRK